jgi:succinyl-CoA synthetase beta subunit
VFGGITACDQVANGILQAYELLEQRGTPVKLPIVVRLDGNNAQLGHRILDDFAATLPPGSIDRVETMDDAARRAAELAATGQGQGA